jgi:tetratricopeptide (TPR) repeat protein
MPSSRIELFRKAIEQDPANELAHFSLANELCEERQFAEALPHYEACLTVNPGWMRVYIQVGKCCLETGVPQRARESLLRAKELMSQKGDYENLQEVEELLEGLEDYEE